MIIGFNISRSTNNVATKPDTLVIRYVSVKLVVDSDDLIKLVTLRPILRLLSRQKQILYQMNEYRNLNMSTYQV